jgi:glycosyltransferase involved in cell wall biosynthesis
MISKAVVVGAYQRKLEELACLPDMALTAIAPPAWRDSRGETRLERMYTAGYRLVETPIALNGHFHTHFYPRLAAELTAARPDLVHVDEEPYNMATWQAIRWANAHGVPAVFFTWQNLHRRYPPPFRWIEQYNHRHAAHAIAGNQEAQDILRAKGFAAPITVIPQFGVDPGLFRPAQATGERSDGPRLVVGYAGGLVPEKGVDVLIEAMAACHHQMAAPRDDTGRPGQAQPPLCHLRIAGAGSEQARLQALVDQLGLADCVAFVGRLVSTDMPAFYNTLDVLVVPSRTLPHWKEQFGRVLVEAMACGVPVVGSNSGEIPHVIGDAGLIFPEDNIKALAAILARLASDPQLRAELCQRGRTRVLAHYTQQRIALATYEVYRQALGRGARAATGMVGRPA